MPELDDDLAALVRPDDELGLVTRAEFNALVHAVNALRNREVAPTHDPAPDMSE